MIDWLNANTGVLNVLFSLVVAAATVVYAILTKQLVTETRWMRRSQTEPKVMVRIEPSEVWINLVLLKIENIGSGVAVDVRFEVLEDMALEDDRRVAELGFIKYGFDRLIPRQELVTFLTDMTDKAHTDRSLDEQKFVLRVTYANEFREKYSEVIHIGFSHFTGMMTIGEAPLHAIAGSLKKIERELGHFETGFRRLKVDVYSATDRKDEVAARKARREELQAKKESLALGPADTSANQDPSPDFEKSGPEHEATNAG